MGSEKVARVGSAKVQVVSYYKAYELIADEYGNYQEDDPERENKLKTKEFKRALLMDNYYQVRDGSGNVYFIRESEVNK